MQAIPCEAVSPRRYDAGHVFENLSYPPAGSGWLVPRSSPEYGRGNVRLLRMLTGGSDQRTLRFAAWVLLLSFLPMLTFVGHWPAIDIPLPGTDAYVRIPLSGVSHEGAAADGHSHSHGGQGADQHAQHCHADASGCSDTPVPGLATVAMLREVVGFLGIDGAWRLNEAAATPDLRAVAVDPFEPPPRLVLVAS